MNINYKKIIGSLSIAAALSINICTAQTGYKLTAQIPLQGNGKWDYLTMDEPKNRLFVSHFDRVHVLDTRTNKEIKTIQHLNGVHGIALAVGLNKGFISNGKDNTVSVFNYATLDSITTIPLKADKADAIMYDAFTKTVWVFCGNSNNAAVIDAATNEVLKYVPIGKVPEFAVTNGKGLIYNNLEEGNAVAMIDAKTKAVIKSFPLEGEAAPTGLAIDLANNLLFSTCAETKKLTVLDAASGKIVASLPISNKVDAVFFDASSKLIFCSGGDGITTIIKQESKDKYSVLESLTTKPGAKTLSFNTQTHTLYLSTAKFVAGTKDIQPNSFEVLVYSK